MAVGWICATKLFAFSHSPPQIKYKLIRKTVFDTYELSPTSNPVPSNLFFGKGIMTNRRRNGKLGNGKLTRAIQQSGICLPTIGSGTAVFQASLKTSANLIAICIFVAWLQKTGQLPANTSTVLSQVAFHLIIPCFLLSKVSKTIAFQPQGNLLIIPFLGVMQILAGTILGNAAIRFVRKDTSLKQINASHGEPTQGDENGKINALIVAACAFGNTVTLPLVILSGILSPNDASMASGFVALYMVGWSPFLWSYGYQMFNAAHARIYPLGGDGKSSFLQTCTICFQRIMNPPLYGVLIGILIGGTPLAHVFFPSKGSLPGSFGKADGNLATVYLGISAFLQTIWEATSLLGSASVAVQAIVLACSLAPSFSLFSSKTKNSCTGEQCESSSSEENMQHIIDTQTFWVITFVRLIAMPLTGLLIVKILHVAHLLPSNPVCILTILVLSTMPSAQNLVVLVQLRAKSLAEVLADLLFHQYALSLVTVPLWITAYTALVPLM